MRGISTGLLAVLGLASGAVVAHPARADELPEARSLTLAVEGRIDQHCAMGAIPDLALGDLSSVHGRYRRHVPLDCNVPVNLMIRAANGGLANTAFPNGQGPYKGRLAYRLDLAMPVRKPAIETVTGNFQSSQLLAGGTVSSDGGIALDGFEMAIEFEPLRGDDALLGGDYAEVIELTVTPA